MTDTSPDPSPAVNPSEPRMSPQVLKARKRYKRAASALAADNRFGVDGWAQIHEPAERLLYAARESATNDEEHARAYQLAADFIVRERDAMCRTAAEVLAALGEELNEHAPVPYWPVEFVQKEQA